MKPLLLLLICVIAVVSCDDQTRGPAEKTLVLPKTITEIRRNQKSYENQGYTAVIFPPELTSINARDVNIFSFEGNLIRKVTMPKALLKPKTDGSAFPSFDLLQILAGGGERTLFITINGSNETALFVGNETKNFPALAYKGENLIAIVINKPKNIQGYGAYSFADNRLQSVSLPRSITSANQFGKGAFAGNSNLVKVLLHPDLFNAIKSSSPGLPGYFGAKAQYYDVTQSPPTLLP